MASATGIPEEHPETIEAREDQPLLGNVEDASQKDSRGRLYPNLYSGTASVAQVGILILIFLVWSGIFSQPLILFSAHPLLNSSALLLQVQAALVLQPTATPQHKQVGTRIHYRIQALSVAAFIAGFIVIEVNKGDHARLTSPHGILGATTYLFIILQALFGLIQYFFPTLVLGSVEAGKKLYKYHRISGYVLLILELATVTAATQTTHNLNNLHISLWGILLASVLVIVGVGARIRKHKLGF